MIHPKKISGDLGNFLKNVELWRIKYERIQVGKAFSYCNKRSVSLLTILIV